MSWNYRLDTPMMQLAEEVNKKYDTDAGKMLLCTYLFMVSSEEIKDKQAFFDWVEELNKSCKCDAVREYVKINGKADWLHGGFSKPIYRHYKGNFYEYLGEVTDSETSEAKVAYQAVCGQHEVWVRPKEMFFGNVEVDGKPVPRFEKVDLKDLEKQARRAMDREKIKSLLGQAILRVNEVVPDFEDLDKVLPLLRQAIDELDKSDSGSV